MRLLQLVFRSVVDLWSLECYLSQTLTFLNFLLTQVAPAPRHIFCAVFRDEEVCHSNRFRGVKSFVTSRYELSSERVVDVRLQCVWFLIQFPGLLRRRGMKYRSRE